MAQAIFDIVLGKLCEAAFEEIVALFEVGDKVDLVKRELNRIQSFLKEADKRVATDERVNKWVDEMRGVSDLIQEAIATFEKEVAMWTRKEPGIGKKIERFMKKLTGKQVAAKRRLRTKIDTILERIVEINESKGKFGIENLGERRMIESAVRVGPDRYIIPGLDELKIVGFVADIKKITAQLLDENTTKRSFVSIVGTGGLGKTTLALKIYSSDAVKKQFEVRAWLSISQKFELIDLLKKMLQKLRTIEKNEEIQEEGYFISALNESLRNKKYLIVMDDVWSSDLLPKILVAFPDDGNGSRVLVTSRFGKITKDTDDKFEPYKLPILSEKESLHLFLKTVLPNRDCPTYLLDIAKQLAYMCEGLPLALVVLGGLAKTKTRSRTAWEKLLKTKVWGTVDGNKCMNIISTTYDDMPSALKTCFTYLACFPEDFKIDAENLIRLWVAEEFIPQQDGETLEDTAEDYLEQLAERHMVIVVERNYDDSIRIIRVHDVLLELAINKAKEDNLITVLSNKDVNRSPSTVSSRVTLQSSSGDQLMEHVGPSLHSLHCYFIEEIHDCSRYENMKVCNIETRGWLGSAIRLERSNHLRFLGVRCVSGFFSVYLPDPGQLRNIQTLDLRYAGRAGIEFPDFMWGIETLRHLLFSDSHDISGPPSGAKLTNLQTLGYVKPSDSWGIQLPHITNVRCLMLQNIHLASAKIIASLLQTIENLISLTLILFHDDIVDVCKKMNVDSDKIVVVGEDSVSDEERDKLGEEELVSVNELRDFIFKETNKIVNMQVFPFYQGLQNLYLDGPWVDSLDRPGVIFPLNLVKLHLKLTWLLKDPMPALEKLECLKILILDCCCYLGKKMMCSTRGFPCLEELKLKQLPTLVELKIEEGATPTLKTLKLKACLELKRLEIKEGAMPNIKLLQMKQCKKGVSLPMHLPCRVEQIHSSHYYYSDSE